MLYPEHPLATPPTPLKEHQQIAANGLSLYSKDVRENDLTSAIAPTRDGDDPVFPLHHRAQHSFKSPYKWSQPKQLKVRRPLKIHVI